MCLTLGCKQKITRGKLHSIFPANKITIAGDNDIHLVAIVWDLRIGVGGRYQRASRPEVFKTCLLNRFADMGCASACSMVTHVGDFGSVMALRSC